MQTDENLLLKISRRAMATDFELLLHRDLAAKKIDAAVEALEMVESLEAELTVYNPASSVSRLNAVAARGPVRLSTIVFELIRRSVELSQELGGAFDITAGPLIDAWGFTDRSGKRPSRDEIETTRQQVGWQYLELDAEAQTVRFTKPGVKINFGAIGKGYALDRIAARLRTESIDDFLLHGGNSSLIARGNANATDDHGWLVGLMHPTRSNHRIGGVRLRDQALATSGNGKQFFHFRGKRYGHVIDPRTGYPAGDALSVTVVAGEATVADAVATGLFISGSEEIQRFAQDHPSTAILLTLAEARQGEVRVESFNAPPDAYQYS